MSIQLCSLCLNEEEWIEKNYLQHKDWPGMVKWVFVHGADVMYGEANPDMVTSDGLSVDNTKSLLDELAKNDSRVKVIHHGWMRNKDPAQGKCEGRSRYLEAANNEVHPEF